MYHVVDPDDASNPTCQWSPESTERPTQSKKSNQMTRSVAGWHAHSFVCESASLREYAGRFCFFTPAIGHGDAVTTSTGQGVAVLL